MAPGFGRGSMEGVCPWGSSAMEGFASGVARLARIARFARIARVARIASAAGFARVARIARVALAEVRWGRFAPGF